LSNTNDSFIDEVTEEVRRDKLFALMQRFGWIAVVAILVLVGGNAWTQWKAAQDAAAAQALGDSLYAAFQIEDVSERADALAVLDVGGPAAPAKLMLEAATLAEAGETETAAARLAVIASTQDFPRVWRDLAELQRIVLRGRTLSPEDRLGLIAPLTTPGAPYRGLAREQEALARYDLGEKDAAKTIFEELLLDQDASTGLRLRALQMKVVLEETQDDA
jgi:hypothetical protein